MTLPSFSIIMPTYNRAFCITNAIDSLLAQEYKNWELIIVDDGSTDETEELVRKKYQEYLQSKQIQYIKSKHYGVSKARNMGLEKARYDWIGYLDTDNTLYKNYFKIFTQAIKNNGAKIFYAQSKTEERIIGNSFDRKALERGNYIDLGSVLHKKELFKRLGGFNEDLKRLVDWDLLLRYTKKNRPIFIPKVVLLYNVSNKLERISNTEDLEQAKKIIQKLHHLSLDKETENMFLLKLEKSLCLISTKKFRERRAIFLFKNSDLFDAEWYMKTYPEINFREISPEEHYYRYGWKDGCNPSSKFDGNVYLNENPDVKEAGKNPLEHYLIFGQNEGRYYASINGKVELRPIENIQVSPKKKTKLMDRIRYALEYPIRVQEEYERLKAEVQAIEKMNK